MTFVWLFFIVVGVFIASIVHSVVQDRKQERTMAAAIAALPDFVCSASYIGSRGRTAMAIDDANGKVCFLHRYGRSVVSSVVSCADIVKVEIVEDRLRETTQSGGGMIVMLGSVGKLMGGPLKHVTTETVTRVDLRATVTDPVNPVRSVAFLSHTAERGTGVHQSAIDLARQWLAHMNVLVSRGVPPRR